MKLTKKIILASNLLLTSALISASAPSSSNNRYDFDLNGVSFFSPRSQSTNAARDLVGWHHFINQYGHCNRYGAISVTPSFGQILRSRRASEVLFGTDHIRISGSQAPTRFGNDILADYFGLSPSFEGEVHLDPFIRTGLIDFGLYLGWKDFYFLAHAPAVWTNWKLRIREEIADDGTDTLFPANYMAATAVQEPVESFAEAVEQDVTYGQVSQGLEFGRFGCSHHTARLSNFYAALGWNFINRKNGFAGFNLRVAAPTGTRPTSKFLFEPIVGNGKHWELGLGFSGRILLWEKDGTQEFSFFTDVNITHLFKSHQCRSFDFITNGFGSRYILVKEFDASGNYTGVTMPAINISTLACDVKVDAQLDIVFMFGYTYNPWTIDIGYNGWIRTREIITLRDSIKPNTYGFKGIQNVTDILGNNINTTQSTATLHGDSFVNQAADADSGPIFIDTCNVDLYSAASPLSISHKLFGHIGYSWIDCYHNLTPYLGIGGEVEFEGINQRKTVIDYKDTLSQWSIWLKGGIGF